MSSLFFVDNIDSNEVQLLENEEAHHAIKVLRLSLGEQLIISDGKNTWVSGEIIEVKIDTVLGYYDKTKEFLHHIKDTYREGNNNE